jgi:hypothetical protein
VLMSDVVASQLRAKSKTSWACQEFSLLEGVSLPGLFVERSFGFGEFEVTCSSRPALDEEKIRAYVDLDIFCSPGSRGSWWCNRALLVIEGTTDDCGACAFDLTALTPCDRPVR